MKNTNIISSDKTSRKKIIGITAILFLLGILCFFTFSKDNKLFTHQELVQMPAMELYELFLDNGLNLPEQYKKGNSNSNAEYLKTNLDTLSQGFTQGSAVAHREFAQSVQKVYEKITYPPGTKMTDQWKKDVQHEDSGYTLEINMSKTPLSNIKGEIAEISTIIKDNYEEYELWSSILPGHWYKEFESSQEAMEYIGLSNLHSLNWNLKENNTGITAFGNSNGEIEYIILENSYEIDSIRLQATATIYTDKYSQKLTTGASTTENLEFYDSYLCTENHMRYQVVGSTELDSGVYMQDAYLVSDDVLYRIHFTYEEDEMETVNELMYEWACLLS